MDLIKTGGTKEKREKTRGRNAKPKMANLRQSKQIQPK